ncbi:MAG: MFS transporter [Pseudomonadota bacterium]
MSVYFIFSLTLFSIMSARAGQVLLTLYALKLGAQPFAVGILAATYSALPMLLSWQVGKLADRFGSRWLLMFGAVGGACGMLVPYYLPGLPALYIAAVMNGLLFAFSGVSFQNLVGLLSNPHDRSRNFSNYSLVVSVTGFLGPLLSGFSIDHSGHAVACLYLVLLSLLPVGMLAIWGDALPKGSRTAPPAGSVRDMLAGSGLWRVLATSSLVVTGVDLFQFYLPIYGHGIGLSASAIGVVLAMFSAAAFVVRLIIPWLIARLTEEKLLACSFFLGAACLMLVPFFKSAVVLALVSFVFGLGMGCGQPITLMLTFSNSVEGRSGEALGLRVTVNHLTRVVVPIVFGSIGSVFGLFPVFWGNALMLASGGAITKPGTIDRERTCQ